MPPSTIDPGTDNDGDGIANSHDPDDDDDGVTDEYDSHPFDPTRGEMPTPSAIDPHTDSDGDGIANSHDPDDDNDGVVDEDDCAPFDPEIQKCAETPAAPGTGEPAAPSTGGHGRYGSVDLSSPRFVMSLPSTGAGVANEASWTMVLAIVAVMGVGFLLGGRVLRARR